MPSPETLVKLMQNLFLDPLVIAVLPRWSEAVGAVSEMSVDHIVALAESEQQASGFRASWAGNERIPLLLLRCTSATSLDMGVDTVNEITSRAPGRPVAILLADGPSLCGFKEERRFLWNRDFAKRLTDTVLDLQIHEYSPSWPMHPPRIR